MLPFLKKKPRPMPNPSHIEYIVVGLGNPGPQYQNTRHNTGFLAIDNIAESLGVQIKQLKFKSLCANVMIENHHVLLMKPQTFMNLSGQAVKEAMHFYNIESERIILLFDDISIPLGKIRIRTKGSAGGHNGVKNILYLSGSESFPRIKIGVGEKPNPEYDLSNWVLSKFSKQEISLLDTALTHTNSALRLILDAKIKEAMNQFNS